MPLNRQIWLEPWLYERLKVQKAHTGETFSQIIARLLVWSEFSEPSPSSYSFVEDNIGVGIMNVDPSKDLQTSTTPPVAPEQVPIERESVEDAPTRVASPKPVPSEQSQADVTIDYENPLSPRYFANLKRAQN